MIAATTMVSVMMLADSPDAPQHLQALVQEVRWLRGALAAGMRMQLTMHRIGERERAYQQVSGECATAQMQIRQIEFHRQRLEEV